jgi:hypothetical protein
VKRLERFPVSTATSRYPWDELLNGDVWELVSGDDFQSRPATVISNARNQARRRGGRVRTRLFVEDGRTRVVLQYVRHGGEN